MQKHWEHDLQLSIHCYYVGETETGLRASERVLNSEAPDTIRYNALQNLTYYLRPLSNKFNVTYTPLHSDLKKEGWSLFNPTIINYQDNYLVLVRSSNYLIDEHGRYVMPEIDCGVIKTNYIQLTLNKNLEVIDQKNVFLPDYQKTTYPVDGLEDLRIFECQNKYYVSGTMRNMAPYDGMCRIALASYDPETASISNIEVMDIKNGLHEKNWMPINNADSIKWLYQTNVNDKTIVLEHHDEFNGFKYSQCNMPAGKSFRGGSQLIKIQDKYYSVVHEAAGVNEKRIYTHRIVEWDEDFQITRFSKSFYLKEQSTIEFCAGMCCSEDQVHLVFGVYDREAWMASLAVSDFLKILDA